MDPRTPRPPSRDAFPTLAERLADGRPDTEDALGSGLMVVIEGAIDPASIASALPPGSVVSTVTGDGSLMLADPAAGERLNAPPLTALLEAAGLSRHDVLLLTGPGHRVTRAMLDGLRVALAADSACATVSVDDDSRQVAVGLPPPATLAPQPGVVLVSRDHLLLAAEEAEFTTSNGSVHEIDRRSFVEHVLALLDRPGFVHRRCGPAGTDAPALRVEVTATLRRRPGSIVIDGRCLEYSITGTQVQLLGLIGGLARLGAEFSVMMPSQIHPTVLEDVECLASDVPFVDYTNTGRAAVFHRPFQVVSLDVLADCLSAGDRFVLTQQDMIFDRVRDYHIDEGGWHDYRSATAASLSSADAVGFFSLAAAKDAASDGELDPDRATVIPLGVDHLIGRVPRDAPVDPLLGRPYLFVVGTALWHKNRLFSMRLLRWLVERGGWDGGLVLAGGHPGRGSSVAAERAFLERTPSLAGRVVDLGHVPGPDQLALYRDAELVLFPSLYEGFGFIPFEAAALGTACVYNHRSSMRELLPVDGALPSFDLDEAGPFVAGLLATSAARQRIVQEITRAARELTWDRTARGYFEVYERALECEPNGVSRRLLAKIPRREEVLMNRKEVVLVDVYRRRRAFRAAVDATLRAGQLAAAGARRLKRGRD